MLYIPFSLFPAQQFLTQNASYSCHLSKCLFIKWLWQIKTGGRDFAVGITTRYRLYGPGSNTSLGKTFPTCLHRPHNPPMLLCNAYSDSFPYLKWSRACAWRWPPTTIKPEVIESVGLYLHPLPCFRVIERTLLYFKCGTIELSAPNHSLFSD
jgi:hypothetical protein